MAQTSSRLDDLDEAIEQSFSYGDTKADWLRRAVRMKFQLDGTLEELFEPIDEDKREMFVEQAVWEKVWVGLTEAVQRPAGWMDCSRSNIRGIESGDSRGI